MALEDETKTGDTESEICLFCSHTINPKAFLSDELKNYRYSGGERCVDCYVMMEGVKEPTLNDRLHFLEISR